MMLETGGQLVVSLTSVIGNVSSTWDLTDFSEGPCIKGYTGCKISARYCKAFSKWVSV